MCRRFKPIEFDRFNSIEFDGIKKGTGNFNYGEFAIIKINNLFKRVEFNPSETILKIYSI
jgi:hypothetical protein